MARRNSREGEGSQRDPLSTGTSTEKSTDSVVLLCGELAELGRGLELQELSQWLERTTPGVQVSVVPALCRATREAADSMPRGLTHLVLGLCSSKFAEAELQSQAKRAGLDPYGIEFINLGLFCALVEERRRGTEKAKLLLAAAVAKARACPEVGQENLRPYFLPLGEKVSRRSLFTLPPIRYKVVASINGERCVADAGCALCVRACPRGAFQQVDGRILVDKTRCEGCGLCLAACPKEAIQLPGSSPIELEAQLTSLLEAEPVSVGERRILFACRQSVQAAKQVGQDGIGTSASWLPLEVPCAGMVPVGVLLQCVARGAAVGVLSCGKECLHAQRDVVRGRVDYCRQLLHLLGASPERVKVMEARDGLHPNGEVPTSMTQNGGPPPPVRRGTRVHVGDPGAAAEAACELAEQYGAAPGLFFEHPHSPVGKVLVDPERCTGCGVCAAACPTKALDFVRDGEEVALTFDPSLCVSCDRCVTVCPEAGNGAIRVARVTDTASLMHGRAALYQDREKRCMACGAPIATAAMLARIAHMLGSDYADISNSIEQYCPACR